MTQIGANAFEHFETKAHCIWLDLNDVMSPDDLFEQLIDAMYYRLGSETWLPVYIANDAPAQAAEVRRLASCTARPWVMFFNARETPGCNQPDFVPDPKSPNGWIDDTQRRPGDERLEWHTGSLMEFISLLTQLCPSDSKPPIITVVLLLRGMDGSEDAKQRSPVCKKLLELGAIDEDGVFDLRRSCSKDFGHIVRVCCSWVARPRGEDGRRSREQFLHRLVLMERTRFLSSVWHTARISHGRHAHVVENPIIMKNACESSRNLG